MFTLKQSFISFSPCLSTPCQARSLLPAAGPTVRRSLPALTSWCATTACTRGTWPSCSLPSEEEEDEEEEDMMSCQRVEEDAGAWSAVMGPCQTRWSGEPSWRLPLPANVQRLWWTLDLHDAPQLELVLVIRHKNSDREGTIPQSSWAKKKIVCMWDEENIDTLFWIC